MELQEFDEMVRRQRPTEITAEVVASVVGDGRNHGSAAWPKRRDLPGYSEGTLSTTFEAEFSVGDLVYTRSKPGDERWQLQT